MLASRRAFLTGRPLPNADVQALLRLTQSMPGARFDSGDGAGAPVAWVSPADASQVRMLFQWCTQFKLQLVPAGVCPGLDDALEHASAGSTDLLSLVDPATPAICVDVRRHLSDLTSVENGGLWRAGPGCTIGDLPAAIADELLSHPHAHPGQTLGAWFARSGRSRLLQSVDVMLSDGSRERFGPMGAGGVPSVRSPLAKRLVSGLFQMLCEPLAQSWCASDVWRARYRLDALRVDHRRVPDMARVLAGSRGTLAWVEQFTFHAVLPRETDVAEMQPGCDGRAAALEHRIKALFDPSSVFPHLPARASATT